MFFPVECDSVCDIYLFWLRMTMLVIFGLSVFLFLIFLVRVESFSLLSILVCLELAWYVLSYLSSYENEI